MIELRALGGLRLRDSADGHEILSVLARAKPSSLLVYLALSPPNVVHGRDKLFELLWPDSSTKRARNSLNHALHVLRSGLGPGVIETTEGGELFLEAGAVWCDVAGFDEALAAGHPREALELYGGHLWDGSDLNGSPIFDRWLDGERQRLRLQAVAAAVTLAQELKRDGSFVDAAQWLRQARDWAPYDESVVRPLLKLLHGLGERDAAVREYDAYKERLAEVELTPSTEMSDLIEKIRSSTGEPPAVGPEPAVLAVIEAEPTGVTSPTEAHKGGSRALASVTTQRRASWRTRGRAAAAIVVLGAIATAGATVMRNGRGDEPPLDPTRLLVDLFQNETGDPTLDPLGRMATDRVTAGLTYTGFVDVVSLGTQLLSLEPVVADAGSTERSGRLRALARANGTGTVVSGTYYMQSDSVHFLARVTNAATGEELTTIEPIRGSVDEPLAAIERLRDRVMTTLATLTDPQLARWMRNASQPPTFEAYTEFAKGVELHTHRKPREALPHFLAAEALDADFTMASLWAAFSYENSGRWRQRDSIGRALNERRGQLAPLDRLLLDYQLAYRVADYHGALDAMRRFVEIAPGSEFLYKAGQAAVDAGRPAEAIEFMTQVDPESGWLRGWWPYWDVLAAAYHAIGEHQEELVVVRRGRRQFPNNLRRTEIVALAALGRTDEVQAMLENHEKIGLHLDGGVELIMHGHTEAASQVLERGITREQAWQSSPRPETTGQMSAGTSKFADMFLLSGRIDEARDVLERAVEERWGDRRVPSDYLGTLGVIAGIEGDRERALEIDAYFRPAALRWHARIAASLGEMDRASALHRDYAGENSGDVHSQWPLAFEVLGDYAAFQELMRPKGSGPLPN